ncbi:hypothetical protein K435DRAFT_792948 [Dendrothele bispora CBS 962.96]|uniref:SWIM-type domain-containing protein n=1 Tax=Dendrothele bispora (strain CBS 962.96) TaxID=1314807 RepID=A0A4S8MH62_DENBC|nr:hypothetical protein K435DRAFT_792948 [Dendrothele bispora CBS 962.96]
MPKDSENEISQAYVKVVLHEDNTLQCMCDNFYQTGKTCRHTFAVSLLLKYGPASRFMENETINAVRGREAKGRSQNIQKLKSQGRDLQQRTDYGVLQDLDYFLERWEKESDIDPLTKEIGSRNTDDESHTEEGGESAGEDGDDDFQLCSQRVIVSKGRPARSQPMQPYRATSRRKVPTQFQAKPGPKGERLHPLSLLHKGPAHLQTKEAKERVNFFPTYELIDTLTKVKAQGIKNLQIILNRLGKKIPLKPEPKHKLDQIKELGSVSHPQVRQQLLRGPEPAGFENDEIEALFEKNVNRWNGADYFLRQDEMYQKGSNCLFLANEYQTLGQRLIECGPDHSTDELEILKPEWFGPGTIYAQLIHYTTHFLSKTNFYSLFPFGQQ